MIFDKWFTSKNLCTAIDIGSSKITCCVMKKDNNATEVVFTKTYIARGIKNGNVMHMSQFRDAISNAIMLTEHGINKTINDVCVSIGDIHIAGEQLSHEYVLADIVHESDIVRFLRQQNTYPGILHLIPLKYKLDEVDYIENPINMRGRNMRVDMFRINTSQVNIDNIMACFQDLNISVNKMYCAQYVASLITTTEDERRLGCIIVEIGHHVTTITIFEHGYITYIKTLAIGGQNITRDGCYLLDVHEQEGEKAKILHGAAIAKIGNKRIPVERFYSNNIEAMYGISGRHLNYVIQCRLEEIFDLVINEIGRDVMYKGGVVIMIGGVSKTTGIRELAMEHWNKVVRIGSVRVPGCHAGAIPMAAAVGSANFYLNRTNN